MDTKKCIYCDPGKKINERPVITIPDAATQEPCCSRYGYVVTEDGLLFVLHADTVMGLLPAKRCPMCGRPLKQKEKKCTT